MTLIQLEYVLAVAESKNFTLAAEKVFVTQPTLSMQIQKLEKELNIEIFDRSTHPIKITSVGQVVIKQAKQILKESRRMHHIVNELRDSIEGEFVVGIIPTVLPTLTPLFYKSFKKKFPKAHLVIKEMKTEQMVVALEDNEIDFGIAVTPLYDDSIIELPLYYEPMVAYIPPAHRLSDKATIDEKDLELKDLLLLEEGHCFRNNVLSICALFQTDEAEEGLGPEVDSGSFYTLVRLAKDGFGMTVLPSLMAEELKEDDKKLLKKFNDPVPTREVSIIYHETQLRLKFVEEMQKLIQSLVRGKIFLESEHLTMPKLKLDK